MIQNIDKGGSGCGAVGRAVTSDTGDPLFESSHGQFYLLSTVLLKLYRIDKNKERGWEWPF